VGTGLAVWLETSTLSPFAAVTALTKPANLYAWPFGN
jgi:hypothetical protein